ncbi:MAG: hypothetical protein JNM00_06970, partial [Flavobacteriales bacterium]|nr:hypothetical protein [Flavobacteriales bacterium]
YGVPANTTIECDQDILPAFPYAIDNCDSEPMVSLDATTVPQECGYLFVRTWTAVDNCGNVAYAYQTITVVDTTDPYQTNETPAEISVECDEDVPAFNPTFADNCDEELTLVAISGLNNVTDCSYDIERSVTATDDCGNSITVSQVVHVADYTAPYITNPPVDLVVECDEDVPAYVPVWGDNCDEELTLQALSSIGFDDCYTFIHQTYIATDDCGNTASVVRNINIVDTTPPVIYGVPADETVECDNVPGLPTSVYATDNCDESVDLSVDVQIIPGEPVMVGAPPCGYTIIRTWTAIDECGNIATAVQTITVVDTTAPVLYGVPADVTVECTEIPAPADVTAVDNCDDVPNLFMEETIIQIDECSYRIIRTWIVEDNCWNYYSESQIITVTDYTAPVFSGTDTELTLECSVVPTVVPPTVTDACDSEPEVDFELFTLPGECENAWTWIYQWTATDDCGNSSVRTYTYHFEDTTAPVIYGVPADETVECDAEIPAAVPFAIDNCDDLVDVSVSAETIPQDCGYLFVRTWTAADNCGNTSYAYQTVTVVDTTDPVAIYVPADITIECDEVVPMDEPIFTDNCDNELTIEFSDIVEGDCPWYWICTWTATDDCGNSVSVTRTITVIDTTAPVFDPYQVEVTVSCELADQCVLTATDNCDGNVEIVITDELNYSGGCLGTIERT